MELNAFSGNYRPGMYTPKRPLGAQLAENYFREINLKLAKQNKKNTEMPPTICFSRKIGVGALEIADSLAQKIDYTVVDREIIEYIAEEKKLRQKTVAYFDERYPGKINDLMRFLFAECSFVHKDYSESLFKCVLAMAGISPTIFVGRGTHLILPREKVLAVRLICSTEFRLRRLSDMLGVDREKARQKLMEIDREQRSFFSKVFKKKDAPADEFDLVINRDYIRTPEIAADIVACAFEKKFARADGSTDVSQHDALEQAASHA